MAVNTQRRPASIAWGTVRFIIRDVAALDVVRADTELASGWVTSIEQTMLDVADRPAIAGGPAAASEIVIGLASRADWGLVADLARAQGKRSAFARARWVADPVVDDDTPRPPRPPRPSRYADPAGMDPPAPVSGRPFGVSTAKKHARKA